MSWMSCSTKPKETSNPMAEMKEWRIPFAQPSIGEEEIEAVEEVLRSTWLTQGRLSAEFESAFAEKFGFKYAVLVSSCTAALHLSHIGLGIRSGDEVICPALTFVASANAARYVGATPVFVDVCSLAEPTLSPDAVRAAITPRTKAIVVVHFAGFAARMEELLEIAKDFGLAIIEDCAHSPGARCRVGGRPHLTGALGRVGCFSFFSNKNMTSGEGGMIVTDELNLAERFRELRSHAMTTQTADRQKSGGIRYDVNELGFHYRSNEIAAAIGLCQLAKLDGFNAKRRSLYGDYLRELRDVPGVTIPFSSLPMEDATPHIVPLYFDEAEDLLKVKSVLNFHGIQVSRHYELVPNFSAFSRLRRFASEFPNIENTLSVPLYPSLSTTDVAEVSCHIVSCLIERR